MTAAGKSAFQQATGLTKGEVNRAGKALRLGPENVGAEAYERAEAVYDVFRAAHDIPTLAVKAEIYDAVLERYDATVTNRAKRLERVVEKLRMLPTRGLEDMQDIGGCRAVLPDLSSVAAVDSRLQEVWGDALRDRSDYIAVPKESGYRSQHLVVERDGLRVEAQLRTQRQDYWAQAVENASRLGYRLKDGMGPDDLLEYFAVAADKLALEDGGQPADPVLETRLAELRKRVIPYFRGDR